MQSHRKLILIGRQKWKSPPGALSQSRAARPALTAASASPDHGDQSAAACETPLPSIRGASGAELALVCPDGVRRGSSAGQRLLSNLNLKKTQQIIFNVNYF